MQGIDFNNLSDHKVFHLDTSLGGSNELLQLSTFKCQFIKDLLKIPQNNSRFTFAQSH
jgi:hypothetical protein